MSEENESVTKNVNIIYQNEDIIIAAIVKDEEE
jgi:hypothetical protein